MWLVTFWMHIRTICIGMRISSLLVAVFVHAFLLKHLHSSYDPTLCIRLPFAHYISVAHKLVCLLSTIRTTFHVHALEFGGRECFYYFLRTIHD